jgi:hypothetical protein
MTPPGVEKKSTQGMYTHDSVNRRRAGLFPVPKSSSPRAETRGVRRRASRSRSLLRRFCVDPVDDSASASRAAEPRFSGSETGDGGKPGVVLMLSLLGYKNIARGRSPSGARTRAGDGGGMVGLDKADDASPMTSLRPVCTNRQERQKRNKNRKNKKSKGRILIMDG